MPTTLSTTPCPIATTPAGADTQATHPRPAATTVAPLRAEYARLLACDAWCAARTSDRPLAAGRVTYLGDARYSAAEVAERDAARPGMWLALSERMEAAGVSVAELETE